MPGRAKDADSDNDANISLGPNATRQPKPKTHKAPVPRVGSRSSADLLQRARTPADVLHLQSHGENGSKSGQSDKHNRAQSQQSNGGAALGTTAIASSSKAPSTAADSEKAEKRSKGGKKHQPKVPLTYHDLMKWIQREKSRRAASKARKKDKKRQAKSEDEHHDKDHKAEKALAATLLDEHDAEGENADEQDRRPSDASSEGSAALEMLQDILERNVGIFQHPFANRSTRSLQRPGSIRKLRRASTAASSETDFYDGEPSVPSCNVFLDNSRAVISANDVPASPTASRPNLRRSLSTKDKESWKEFKFEIVRLSHTLKVKGWRRVPMDRSDDVTVERLSGALTNSVYVVTPPIDIADESQSAIENENMKPDRRARPRKLLLRIYGAQVEHLIDRESELAILRRLARKRIGPRMLGTFKNGRFEEHFNARPLTAEELRQPDCSRQIAKRMRELHDGIELLHSEVAAGPFVWQNIDKWMRRCERIVEWVEEDDATDAKKLSKDRVVGADFELFKDALNRYRKWLEEKYNGWDAIRERLVFAHNDVPSLPSLRYLILTATRLNMETFFDCKEKVKAK
jgi:choline kinase